MVDPRQGRANKEILAIFGLFLSTQVWVSCAHGDRQDAMHETDEGSSSSFVDSQMGTQTQKSKPQSTSNENGREPASTVFPTKITDQVEGNTEATADYHFGLAQAYVAEGNPDRAIEEYKVVLMYDPKSALIHTRIAGEQIKKGSLSEAMESAKAALEIDPNYVDARLLLAGLYATTRDAISAIAEYDKILKVKPDHEETIIYKSQLLVEKGSGKDAAKFLEKYLKRNPESVLSWYYLGRAYMKIDRFKEAVISFHKALEIKPSFAQCSIALGLLYESKSMNKLAQETYAKAYDYSQDPSIALRLTTILLKEEKYKEAIPYLEAMAAADPEDMNVRIKLGLVNMELKNHSKAIDYFKGILAKNPDSDRVRYYLGNLYEELKRTEDAIAEFSLIPPASKLYGEGILHAAYLYKNSDRIELAKNLVDQAIQKSPRFPGFYLFKASLKEEESDFAGSARILETASQMFPEDEKMRYYLGSMYDRLGKTDLAIVQMETILTLNPNNVDALNYIGYTWTIQGVRLGDAESLLKKALRLKPDSAYIQDSWGWHLYVRGRVQEAVVELEKAVKLKPNESTILEHLGDAYARSNLQEKALYQYELAVQYSDDVNLKRSLENKIESMKSQIALRRTTRGRTLAGEPDQKP